MVRAERGDGQKSSTARARRLRAVVENPGPATGRFRLTPHVPDLDSPTRTSVAPADTPRYLADFIGGLAEAAVRDNSDLDTPTKQLRFIITSFEWADVLTAEVLGRTQKQVESYRRKGLHRQWLPPFEHKFLNLFGIASALNRAFPGEDNAWQRRAELRKPNGKYLGGRTPIDLLREGTDEASDKAALVVQQALRHVDGAIDQDGLEELGPEDF